MNARNGTLRVKRFHIEGKEEVWLDGRVSERQCETITAAAPPGVA